MLLINFFSNLVLPQKQGATQIETTNISKFIKILIRKYIAPCQLPL